jgi:hypothetical protein
LLHHVISESRRNSTRNRGSFADSLWGSE